MSFHLHRFIDAQDEHFPQILAELNAGRKQTHWMWYVFPQLKGLGRSTTANYYAISSQDEARAYWRHAVLGPRLRACTQAVNQHGKRSAQQVFGHPDHLKFHSCMTLFAEISQNDPIVAQALDQFFKGERDKATLDLLETGGAL
ncbi:DUF1810 domain-containing protein [Gilvimarinus algae]|uniref:DUF1810 domain-containing protein n=1 Tax=Gilvimarinus algae TaxID=3058037 RepID=A0ABT8TG23_9GAMM|nr:DUF1810 domain-containing protein [Gilvimarinus sp. SDUM040014]MDO3381626.1 DUF1810 domain-containing protein [Gilvimarinus sp. SDUM040014]